MTSADHYLGIRKDFTDYLGRGGISMLPVNSNLHTLLFSSSKINACSMSFGTFETTIIEWLLDYSCLLAQMVVVQ